MPKRAVRVASCTAVLSAVAAMFFGCLDATQIQVVLAADDGLCTARTRYLVRVVDTAAALDALQEEVNAGAPFPRCPSNPGGASELGDVSVVPSGSDGRSKRIVVEVTIGVDGQDPSVCGRRMSEGNPRCYVVRRRLAFVPHRALRVPTYFDQRCAGRACDPASTCYRGSCVDAEASCEGADCLTAAERAGGTGFDPTFPKPDADAASEGGPGVPDASLDAPTDSPTTDAGSDARTGTTGASPLAVMNSRNRCSFVPGTPTACCNNSSPLAAPLDQAAGCTGEDSERLCQTASDCPSGADCVDVISGGSGFPGAYPSPRAACVQRGCTSQNGIWGREGAIGNRCEGNVCCRSTSCNAGTCN